MHDGAVENAEICFPCPINFFYPLFHKDLRRQGCVVSEEQVIDISENGVSRLRSTFNSFALAAQSLRFVFRAQNNVLRYLQTSSPSEEQLLQIIEQSEKSIELATSNGLEAKRQLLDSRLAQVHAILGGLTDPEVPNFGRDYVTELQKSGVDTWLNPRLEKFADYIAYQNGTKKNTFAHSIGIPPDQMKGDIYPLISSFAHEAGHAIPTVKAEALKHSPFNSDTKTILHPVDFVKAMILSEQVAYTEQGFTNSLIAKTVPCVQEMSSLDAISVDDVKHYRSRNLSLADALMNAALNALSKPLNINNPKFTFRDHYHKSALENYQRAMSNRSNESDLVYVRLEPKDLHAIGDLGFMPNPLGEQYIHPMFTDPPRLRDSARVLLMEILNDHNIPTLENCPTLSEHLESLKPKPDYAAPTNFIRPQPETALPVGVGGDRTPQPQYV